MWITAGASKVSLSSLSAQELWEQSGRLKEGSELRTTAHINLARKYRDEQRPRQGLLRGREFIMKDLYTFDYNAENALKTYTAVKKAYTELFDELKIPYLVAAADSGNMGGSLSHEFHFASNKGEDTVISCSSCDSVYNEELADGKAHNIDDQQVQVGHASGFDTGEVSGESAKAVSVGLWMAISHDKNTLLRCWYPQYTLKDPSEPPAEREVNSHAVKSIAKAAGIDLDISIENPLEQWATHIQSEEASSQRPRVLDVYDSYVRAYKRPPLTDTLDGINRAVEDIDFSKLDRFPGTNNYLNLVRVHEGDQCSKCGQGLTKTHKATELGHTFHLGTRYSDVLQASVVVDRAHLDAGDRLSSQKDQLVPMQMGCHGIGVSRMISAVADNLADSKGLNWPRAIAPYEVIVVPGKGLEEEAEKIYDALTSEPTTALDVILDDRDKQMGWKLGDADLIGYPVIVVVGKGWKKQRTLEVQCRRLEVREDVALEALPEFVGSLLEKL
ncbi:prolyl-tRNA synthetase [Aspergillus luchuensis]|uniref:Prolyl-tRNA synthetase n=2 Tax=Aspergillus kawachii TaxID=1069201 RepID=A0A146FUX8_ASPKA|nr:prolyl-tRNA synthetase [Aspergillus luchuensis]